MDSMPAEDPEIPEFCLELSFDHLNLDEPGEWHTFKPQSTIRPWMTQRGYPSIIFRVEDCFQFFMSELLSGEHWDRTNECMLICDEELEIALNRNLVHYKNLRTIFMSQVGPAVIVTPFSIIKQRFPSWRFIIQPDLFDCIESQINEAYDPTRSPDLSPSWRRTEFTYSQIASGVCEHIRFNSDVYCDERDPSVVDCSDTLLGDAFKVNTFHRCQITHLISTAIVPSTLKGLAALTVCKGILKGVCPLYNNRDHNRLTRSITNKIKVRIQQLEVPGEIKDFLSEPYLPS